MHICIKLIKYIIKKQLTQIHLEVPLHVRYFRQDQRFKGQKSRLICQAFKCHKKKINRARPRQITLTDKRLIFRQILIFRKGYGCFIQSTKLLLELEQMFVMRSSDRNYITEDISCSIINKSLIKTKGSPIKA